jgi:hypothetical protein
MDSIFLRAKVQALSSWDFRFSRQRHIKEVSKHITLCKWTVPITSSIWKILQIFYAMFPAMLAYTAGNNFLSPFNPVITSSVFKWFKMKPFHGIISFRNMKSYIWPNQEIITCYNTDICFLPKNTLYQVLYRNMYCHAKISKLKNRISY